MAIQNVIAEAEQVMKKTIERLHTDLGAVRTGRASPALLDQIRVNYYGQMVPIQQVGQVVVAEARIIEVRPWDIGVLPELEKAIKAANIGRYSMHRHSVVSADRSQ